MTVRNFEKLINKKVRFKVDTIRTIFGNRTYIVEIFDKKNDKMKKTLLDICEMCRQYFVVLVKY